ncbi:site-specific recombinase [Bradymonas sediminis]|uniref:Uncharacterized protein n=1 Tax=Bradymonas sediminis TaxID=1548548 RepID=A0A2Z4FQZ6_9DELT|nr:hypothetical protein [Bradymonas sediminis]AWV91046.1 hypothetical protein DN745_17600 [Bradymonas sediminis]TDP75213.1 site-specific recombinase [Bradymonas sediminis]
MRIKLEEIFQESSGTQAIRRLVDVVRPPKGATPQEIDERLHKLVDILLANRDLRASFDSAIRETLSESRLVHAFAESGILSQAGFFREVHDRVLGHLLPRQVPEDDIRHVIAELFPKKDDWRWVGAASPEAWAELFALTEQQSSWEHPDRDLAGAIQGLALRIGALGIDEELNAKLEDVDSYDSPFLNLAIHAHEFLERHHSDESGNDAFDLLIETVNECRDLIVSLREKRSTYGTSLRLTSVSRRLLQQLDRLERLAHLIHPDSSQDLIACSVRLFIDLLEAEQNAHSVSRLVKESADLLAFQITEQSAKKGQKYISDTRKGYWKFLRAALQGGAIVAPFGLFKFYLSQFPFSLAAQALIYSLNYSVCFVLIYLTGSILATKQPAVTASAIASKMDEATSSEGAIEGVADVIILVWRSQFISFIGNVFAALPVAALIGFVFATWGSAPLADADGARYLLGKIHPFESGALFYAGIAGVALFTAGVIGGAVENRVLYTNLERRIAEHPGLRWLGRGQKKLAVFVSKNTGMLTGNVALGVMLGCAGPIGVILGLPFDIRHIAFSSAEVGLATFTMPQIALTTVGLVALISVFAIGLFNFLVAFVLTMVAGLASRSVTFGQTRVLVGILVRRFLRRPWEWFYPPKEPLYQLSESVSEDEVGGE